jgi:hypothetical protein
VRMWHQAVDSNRIFHPMTAGAYSYAKMVVRLCLICFCITKPSVIQRSIDRSLLAYHCLWPIRFGL